MGVEWQTGKYRTEVGLQLVHSRNKDLIQVLLPVIDYKDFEVQADRMSRQRVSGMAGAENVKSFLWHDGFNVEVDTPAATHIVLVQKIVTTKMRTASFEASQRVGDHLLLQLSATDTALNNSVRIDQHLGPCGSRRRAMHLHHDTQRDRFGPLAGSMQLFQDVHDEDRWHKNRQHSRAGGMLLPGKSYFHGAGD